MHLIVALSAFALVGTLLLGTMKRLSMQAESAARPPVDVAVEHGASLTFTVTASAGQGRGIVELGRDGTETVHVSVPETWQRREVRGAPLEAAIGEPPAMGFRRWTIPPGATLSFWMDDAPRIRIQNPSGKALLVESKRVDVRTGKVEKEMTLVKDGPLDLW